MAIDSAIKRASIAAIAALAIGPSVVPSGSFDQADRQVIGYSYAGILAGAPPASTNHVRKQLRDAIVTAVTGLTTTGSNVFYGRALPLGSQTPALLVYVDSETVDYDLGRFSCSPMRIASVQFQGVHEGEDDDTLDEISKEVEVAVFAGGNFGGLSQMTELTNTEITRDGAGEKTTGVILITFEISYRTVDGAPSVPV